MKPVKIWRMKYLNSQEHKLDRGWRRVYDCWSDIRDKVQCNFKDLENFT